MIAFTFSVCMLAFASIGLAAAKHKQPSAEDYLLAGRDVGPFATALSAVSTNHSGFMFIGLIGYAYTAGVQAAWLMAGWFVGDVLAWLFVHHRFQALSEASGARSLAELVATGGGSAAGAVARVAGTVSLVFLSGYAAAQLRATGEAVAGIFDQPVWTGALAGALLVLAYSWAGGLRASIWTDTAQASMMIIAMVALMVRALAAIGERGGLGVALRTVDPALVQWIPDGLAYGFVPYLAGFVAGGFGVVGQPHIMVRFMAVRDERALARSRGVYLGWYLVFSASAVIVGLSARVLLPELGSSGAEQALPRLARLLLPDPLIGLVLAGIVAATLSTADSQVLACSASLTQDIAPSLRDSYGASKLTTVIVVLGAALAAVTAGETVFAMVLGAWGILGATLGPVVCLRVSGAPLDGSLISATVFGGGASLLAWKCSVPGSGDVYALLPGFLGAFAAYGLATGLRRLG